MPPKRIASEYEEELKKLLLEKDLDSGKNYKPESVRVFTTSLFKVYGLMGGEGGLPNLNYLLKYKEVIGKITAKNDKGEYIIKLNTQISYFNAIIIGLSVTHAPSELSQHYENIRDIVKDERDASFRDKDGGKVNPPQQAEGLQITKEQIMKMIDSFVWESKKSQQMLKDSKQRDAPVKRRNAMMKALIFYIHTIYPYRNNLAGMKIIDFKEYEEMKYGSEEDEDNPVEHMLEMRKKLGANNWLVVQPKSMTFVNVKYKTSNKYGIIVDRITDKRLLEMLRKWITDEDFLNTDMGKPMFNGTPLLSWAKSGTPLTSNELSHLMLDTTKKYFKLESGGIGSTLMAKIFSLMPDDPKTASIHEMKGAQAQAKSRGHSMATKQSTYDPKK